MKNNKAKQRQTDPEAVGLVNTIVFAIIGLPLIVLLASPIFNYYDPSGEAMWAGLYLSQVIAFIWTLRKSAKFMAARKAREEGGS